MQILEIYIHTIIYIHIHTYTTSSTTTTHTTHTTGGRGVLIHSYTYIYNFFHHHHHHPPPPTPPTPQGGGGYTTTHHHPHHRGEGGTGALLYRPITMGWGGGRYLAMLAHIYIYTRGTQNLHFGGLWPIYWGPKAFMFHGFGVQRCIYIYIYNIPTFTINLSQM